MTTKEEAAVLFLTPVVQVIVDPLIAGVAQEIPSIRTTGVPETALSRVIVIKVPPATSP